MEISPTGGCRSHQPRGRLTANSIAEIYSSKPVPAPFGRWCQIAWSSQESQSLRAANSPHPSDLTGENPAAKLRRISPVRRILVFRSITLVLFDALDAHPGFRERTRKINKRKISYTPGGYNYPPLSGKTKKETGKTRKPRGEKRRVLSPKTGLGTFRSPKSDTRHLKT